MQFRVVFYSLYLYAKKFCVALEQIWRVMTTDSTRGANVSVISGCSINSDRRYVLEFFLQIRLSLVLSIRTWF